MCNGTPRHHGGKDILAPLSINTGVKIVKTNNGKEKALLLREITALRIGCAVLFVCGLLGCLVAVENNQANDQRLKALEEQIMSHNDAQLTTISRTDQAVDTQAFTRQNVRALRSVQIANARIYRTLQKYENDAQQLGDQIGQLSYPIQEQFRNNYREMLDGVRSQLKTSSHVVRTDSEVSKERFEKAQEKATKVLEKAVKKQDERKKLGKQHGRDHKHGHNKQWYQKRKQQWLRKNRKNANAVAAKKSGDNKRHNQSKKGDSQPNKAKAADAHSKKKTKTSWAHTFAAANPHRAHLKLPSPKDLALVLKSYKENKAAGKLDKDQIIAAANKALAASHNDHNDNKQRAQAQQKKGSNTNSKRKQQQQQTKREKAARKNLDLQRKLGRVFHIGRRMIPYKLAPETKREWHKLTREYKELLKGELGKKEVQRRMAELEKKMVAQVRAHPPPQAHRPQTWDAELQRHPFRVFNTLLRRSRFADAKEQLHQIETKLMDKKKPITTVAAWARVQQLVRQHQIPADWAASRRMIKSAFSTQKDKQQQQQQQQQQRKKQAGRWAA